MKEGFGQSFKKDISPVEADVSAELQDFKDAPELFSLLRRLPLELQKRHIEAIDDLTDEEAIEYVGRVLEKREVASRESYISDPALVEYFNEHGQEVWKALETYVFTDTENLLGAGQTARIKRFDFEHGSEEMPSSVAVKYLVTPTAKTLSASGEHDLIREVEQLQKIEKAESAHEEPMRYLKVPHPYFYHQKGKIQSYAMEQIDGINLLEGMENRYSSELKAEFREIFKDIDHKELNEEIDRFFDTMHTICIHGDVKPANFMVSREGKFYVIDFGQSTLAINIDEKSGPAFENLKDAEKINAKSAVRYFFDALKKD